MQTEKFQRKPFLVDGIRVTQENMEDVRKWCDGKIEKMQGSDVSFVFVRVANPATDRQNKAFVGNWVIYMPGTGYKVYTNKSFKRTFEPVFKKPVEPMMKADGPHVVANARPHSVSLDAESGPGGGEIISVTKQDVVHESDLVDTKIAPTSTEEPALEEEEKDK